MGTLREALREIRRYPSAVIGISVALLLVVVSIYTVIALPYREAILLWRGGEEVWHSNPRMVPPAWINFFRREKLPETIVLSSDQEGIVHQEEPFGKGKMLTWLLEFDYQADDFPRELILFYKTTYTTKPPFVSIKWRRPDGREIPIADFTTRASGSFRYAQDDKLRRRIERLIGSSVPVEVGLFTTPEPGENPKPLKGTYQIEVVATTFEPESDIHLEMVVYGNVYGIAGTDHLRRDLKIALLWGAPVALSFGLMAALGTTVTTMIIAAIGTWFGGWVDGVIQRITEVNMMLPFLPILIMVGTFYSRSIWVILGATILLSIFGSGIKTYRAIFLQIRESPYIEAARAYGASDWRIVFRYLVPRILPVLIPNLVTLIPTYVFLEASLAVIGLGDPILPTWGKIIQDAVANGALYKGLYYWVLEPAILLMATGLGFAMLGFSLDRIFNPRLREM